MLDGETLRYCELVGPVVVGDAQLASFEKHANSSLIDRTIERLVAQTPSKLVVGGQASVGFSKPRSVATMTSSAVSRDACS